jgi:polar amino acid transport system substrate-binding protein
MLEECKSCNSQTNGFPGKYKNKVLLFSTVTLFELNLCSSFWRNSMKYQMPLLSLGAALLVLGFPGLAQAHAVLEKVVKSGVLTAGTSSDAFPFAFKDNQGRLTGYSVEMLNLIQTQVSQELKRPVALELVAVAPQDRIPKLQRGELDIVCDFTSFTWKREADVDFSVSYAITGTRLLVKRGSALSSPASIAGKRIGVLPGTTGETSIRRAQPAAQIILFQDRAAARLGLQAGNIDAFADDDVLLEDWVSKSGNQKLYQVADYPYSTEGVACMLPENNSTFRDAVNFSLIRYMQGFLAQRKPNVELFNRWFGPQGASPLTVDLRNLMLETMQIVVDSYERLPDSSL